MEDDTPVYDLLFELQMNLCERFPAMTPLVLRREKAREVFLLLVRYNRYAKKQKKSDSGGKRVIRKPAGDNWF